MDKEVDNSKKLALTFKEEVNKIIPCEKLLINDIFLKLLGL